MKKCDLLALIEACQDKLKSINTDNLSNNEKEKLEKILAITSEHYNIISQANENDVDLFNNYAEMYTRIYYNVLNKETKNLDNNETGLSVYSQLSVRDNNDLIPIEVEDQNLENRKKAKTLLKIIAGTGSIMLAIAILANTPKSASPIVMKVLKSAIANAEHNLSMSTDKLYVQEVYANDGLIMKRFMPRAKGSAAGIQKRTSHITVVLNERK